MESGLKKIQKRAKNGGNFGDSKIPLSRNVSVFNEANLVTTDYLFTATK